MRFFAKFYSNILNIVSTKFNNNLFFLKWSPSFLFKHFITVHTFILSRKLVVKFFSTRIWHATSICNFVVLVGMVVFLFIISILF